MAPAPRRRYTVPMIAERWRHALSWTGLLLWFAYPVAFLAGRAAEWSHRCGHRTFSGEFDDCFNDMLPILELAAPVMTLLLAYPFARLAFSIFAPAPERRTRRWRMASRSGGARYFPAFQIAAALGIAWVVFHVRLLPPFPAGWPFHLYWAAWTLWFMLGAWASWPREAPEG